MRSLILRRPIEVLSSERQQRGCGGHEHVKKPAQLPSLVVLPEQQRDLVVGLPGVDGLVLLGVVQQHRPFNVAAVYARPREEFNLDDDAARGLGRVNSSHASRLRARAAGLAFCKTFRAADEQGEAEGDVSHRSKQILWEHEQHSLCRAS